MLLIHMPAIALNAAGWLEFPISHFALRFTTPRQMLPHIDDDGSGQSHVTLQIVISWKNFPQFEYVLFNEIQFFSDLILGHFLFKI
jgi:hypothetical protein